jgi:hypothetical protein
MRTGFRNRADTYHPVTRSELALRSLREASIATGPGGKNSIYVPSIHRYYIGVPQHGKTDDQILV